MRKFQRFWKFLLVVFVPLAGGFNSMAAPHKMVFCTTTLQEEQEVLEGFPSRKNTAPAQAAREMPDVEAGGILSLHRCAMKDGDLQKLTSVLLEEKREMLSRLGYLILSGNELTAASGPTLRSILESNLELFISLWGCPAFGGRKLKDTLGCLFEGWTLGMKERLVVLSYSDTLTKAQGNTIFEEDGLALLPENWLERYSRFYEFLNQRGGYTDAESDLDEREEEETEFSVWEVVDSQ